MSYRKNYGLSFPRNRYM